MDKVYAFQYCDCIYDSLFCTESLHRTMKGAEIAMEFHKEDERKEHERMYKSAELEPDYPFDTYKAWRVIEMEVHD